tara:strand:+ start:5639 stop:6250 length:612 start_codon:yes stop_codon:yes gene_type:complete
MAGFLDNYETVNQKVIRLHATYPTNRIETSIIDWNPEKGYILIECKIYRHYEDEKPAAIDYAHGMVGAYNVQMKRWYVEDTVSSAIGRCASVVLGTEEKASKESMQQVETLPKSFVEDDPWAKPIWEDGFTTAKTAVEQIKDQLGGQLESESPICPHGHMILKEGEKNGKPYRGHVCPEKVKANQCPAIWYVLGSDGKWKERV